MDLDAIEARANAATDGPWEYSGLTLWGRDNLGQIKADHPEDRTFTAAARTDVPALVARVRELEEALRIHRESIARLDSIKSERGAQIVELKEENERLRDGLDAATGFEFRDPTGMRPPVVLRPDSPAPSKDSWAVVVLEADRDAVEAIGLNLKDALARARDIAKEEA